MKDTLSLISLRTHRSVTVRDRHKLKVFQSAVLRWIYGLKREKVTGSWRKSHNEELHDLYLSLNIIELIK
jgi:hypothetical protein